MPQPCKVFRQALRNSDINAQRRGVSQRFKNMSTAGYNLLGSLTDIPK
jgi:hypothetical protein